MILKPSVSVILYSPQNSRSEYHLRSKYNWAKLNITRQKANITKKLLFFRTRVFLAPRVGLEPTTDRLTADCSTDWANEEYKCWRLPIFPGSCPPSIFGASELNFRVRDGNGWTLTAINTNYSAYLSVLYIKRLRPFNFKIVTLSKWWPVRDSNSCCRRERPES